MLEKALKYSVHCALMDFEILFVWSNIVELLGSLLMLTQAYCDDSSLRSLPKIDQGYFHDM